MLIQHAEKLCSTFANHSDSRTKKARVLLKRLFQPHDPGVKIKKDSEGTFQLRVQGSQRGSLWYPQITSSNAFCTCPDHVERGVLCKHIRAAAGALVYRHRKSQA